MKKLTVKTFANDMIYQDEFANDISDEAIIDIGYFEAYAEGFRESQVMIIVESKYKVWRNEGGRKYWR